jgi:Zn-finger nucleic acid-binding protein
MTAQAGVLTCPHCGGLASVDSPRCAFCAAQLLIEACPRCHARVFHGHKHCPHCGVATASGAPTAASTSVCPRCETPLGIREVGDVALHECGRCLGVFIDATAIERMLTDRQQARAEAVLGIYKSADRRPEPRAAGPKKLYIKCPTCRTIMNRKQFARGANTIVDVCRGHGTWFDAGELPAIVEFVMNGGLERAERTALEEARQAAKQAQADALTAQFRAQTLATPPPASGGTTLLDVLFALWK